METARDPEPRGTIVVCGATGRQGGAVARHLVKDGWRVLGLTRDPSSDKAKRLGAMGVELVQADMADRTSLDRACAGADGLFALQNPMIAGFEGEIVQGRNVADAAKAAGVKHVVYGSAGLGYQTGVPSWDSKVAIAQHMREIGLPLTILRPMALMELMSDKDLYPPVAMWSLMPKLAGGETRILWLATDDVGAIVARVFADPPSFLGKDIALAGDVRSIDECRELWHKAYGRAPRRFPMPLWLFERVAGPAGKDLPTMWRWLRDGSVPLDTGPTRDIHAAALSVADWMARHQQATAAA
jgi:uncharacterized protein YbjT (DUF2867 family)